MAGLRCGLILCAPSYRVGSLAFPAVWVESLLFVCEGFGLRGKHPPFFTPHFLPFLTEQNADGSETQKERKKQSQWALKPLIKKSRAENKVSLQHTCLTDRGTTRHYYILAYISNPVSAVNDN